MDALEQVQDQTYRRIVEIEIRVQSADAGDQVQIGGYEPQLPRRIACGRQQPESHEPPDQFGVQTGSGSESVEAQPR
jgi:hypothetical protein